MKQTDNFIDNTKVVAYKECPRKFFLRHVMHWRGEGTALPLVFGGAWHAAMDTVWQYSSRDAPKQELVQAAMANFEAKWTEEGMPFDLDTDQETSFSPRTPRVAEEMLHNYLATRWNMLTECELLAVEQPFAVPLPDLHLVRWPVGQSNKVQRPNCSHRAQNDSPLQQSQRLPTCLH